MEQFKNKNIEDVIRDNMSEYAAYVLLDRCLPSLEDGLKPVHRRILYSMYTQKAFKFTKSANVAGQVMRLHPHGSTYGTIVGMVQRDHQNIPFLEGKGNFGMHTSRDLAPAADRYSEIKLADISVDMMRNFDKGIVDFVDNYDGTMRMPKVLPTNFPAILAYAQSGIGVGFSSSTASFNLNEICDATKKYLETGEHIILVPDFSTGGSIVKEDTIFKQINEFGNGSVKIRGKAEIIGNEIVITEIPYSTTREAIIEKIVELAKTPKLKEVLDVKDLTGIKGMFINVIARRGTDMKVLLEKLYRFTPLQATYSSNMNVLVNDLPKVMGVHQIIEEWSKWRRSCIVRTVEYDVKKLSEKLNFLRGLEKVLVDIDKVIEIIRTSQEEQIETNLCLYFKINQEQAEEISNMKLRNLNEIYISKKIQDIEKLEAEIKRSNEILDSEDELNKLIIQGLEETKKKYGKPRRTQIVEIGETPTIQVVDVIANYPVWIHLTKEGYCYKFRGTQQPTLKPGDEVIKSFVTENKNELLIFVKGFLCYKYPISQIEETRATSIGVYLPPKATNGAEILNYSVMDEKFKYLFYVYKNNKVLKCNFESFVGSRRVLRNAYSEVQELAEIITLEDDKKLKFITDTTVIEIDTKSIELSKSRNGQGKYLTRKGEFQKMEVI